ncbi:MAG: ABC transporter ATP-binding protein [Lachnospiraceae bacterium]|nr:ABC transporter ATP-binding protein [Lachnospiraceae bacterium]
MIPLLTLSNISYSYHKLSGETKALENISFDVNPGEFIAIVGPSGCGKSTLLSMIAGLIRPEEGNISLDGKTLTSARTRIGYMLQKDHLFEWRTVLSNILLGLEIQNRMDEASKTKALEMLTTYGLDAFADAKPSQLSGGMRQRAALIRTLVLEPDLLLLDEPFSALDYQTRLTVADDIWKIIKKEEKTAILVTHDLSEAVSMADRVLILSARPGRLIKDVPIHFEELEENSPMNRRNAKEFKSYFNFIWKELNMHAS